MIEKSFLFPKGTAESVPSSVTQFWKMKMCFRKCIEKDVKCDHSASTSISFCVADQIHPVKCVKIGAIRESTLI